MKKKILQPLQIVVQPVNPRLLVQPVSKKRASKRPAPPSEQTIVRLNEIVKEAPFCFHFQEKNKDFL